MHKLNISCDVHTNIKKKDLLCLYMESWIIGLMLYKLCSICACLFNCIYHESFRFHSTWLIFPYPKFNLVHYAWWDFPNVANVASSYSFHNKIFAIRIEFRIQFRATNQLCINEFWTWLPVNNFDIVQLSFLYVITIWLNSLARWHSIHTYRGRENYYALETGLIQECELRNLEYSIR